MSDQAQTPLRECMTILGQLDAETFVPWIRRHAVKLGLSHSITNTSPERIDLDLSGAPELIDMMEVGCLLGPIDIWVETIDRRPI